MNEEKKCEYCTGALFFASLGPYYRIGGRPDYILKIYGACLHAIRGGKCIYAKKINYCPMCGRKLSND